MAKHGRGLICLPIIGQRLDELGIPLMVTNNTSRYSTAFTVSIEAKNKVTTGISAYDRAQTIKTVLDSNTKAEDLVKPGHIFPLDFIRLASYARLWMKMAQWLVYLSLRLWLLSST